MRRLVKILGFGALVMYFPVILGFVSADRNNTVCNNIIAEVNDSVSNRFISAYELKLLVLQKYPGILGKNINDVNTENMEHFFEKNPSIENCEVYFSIGGALHVEVKQKDPVLRVFEDPYHSYYLDDEGKKMPVSTKHTAHVLVANGYISRLKDRDELFRLAKFIKDDDFWRSQIEQIYVTSKGEIELIPRVGDHIVEFGTADRMEKKFRNLKALYRNGWDAREWNVYKKVSLKYNGQIVCSKVR